MGNGGFSKTDQPIGQVHYPTDENRIPYGDDSPHTDRAILVCYTWGQDATMMASQTEQEAVASAVRQVGPLVNNIKFKKRLLLRCIHHFKSRLINNMDHMRISGTEPSSVILSQTKVEKLFNDENVFIASRSASHLSFIQERNRNVAGRHGA